MTIQHLRFNLSAQVTALLPVAQVTEVLDLDVAQVTPIPQMAPWVLGVFNWRGEIVWAMDLSYGLGLPPLPPGAHYLTVLAQHRGQRLGLVVQAVEDMAWCAPEELKPLIPTLFPAVLSQVAQGHWLTPEGAALVVLDGEMLLDREFWQTLTA
ncbi:chemotaxis protein CheW [Candidatus Cyanaurora vandensis]|uniref:chemotaxis protein CheW n=1 Tax=Candidatus Cyanaurora vandensis TaxID=2714958 RepID=UPI0025796390|nr:chemotaxis protein CheW [Candidatus Cyanaurora vandensis]